MTDIAKSKDELFADFDHHSSRFRDAVHGTFSAMRAVCPVIHSDQYGGFWSLVDYASVFEAARDYDTFNSFPWSGVPNSTAPYPIIPLESDPPLTGKLRQVTIKHFSPQAAERLRPRTRDAVAAYIDDFIEEGECDIVGQLTTPLPARTILHLLGFDDSHVARTVDLIHAFVHDRTNDEDRALAATAELFDGIQTELVRRRGASDLGNDMFGAILKGTIDDRPLEDSEILMYTIQILLGGMDTTSGLTGNCLLYLADHPDIRQRLIDNPSLLASVTDEFLRHSSPVVGLARTVAREVNFHGARLSTGDRIILMWAAANRDPAVFSEPDNIDLDRKNMKRHMSFGVGVHRCLGSHLAKMMFQEMMAAVLTRLPDFKLKGEPVLFADAGEVHAVRKLPIAFTPGPRLTSDPPPDS